MLKDWEDDSNKNNDTTDCKDWTLGIILTGFAVVIFIAVKLLEFIH